MLQNFPDELIIEILSHLPISDIVNNAQHVCLRWHTLCKSPIVWKGKECRIDGRNKMHEIVETAKLSPQITALCIGKSDHFQAWFTGSYLFISSRVNHSELRNIAMNLHIKSISVPRSIFTECYKELINKKTKVESLTICHGNSNFGETDRTLQLLMQQGLLSELRALHVFGAEGINSETISMLCHCCENLEELCLHQPNMITSEALQNLKKCTKLRILQITETSFLEELSFLKYCPNVIELDISQCYSLKPSAFQHLLHLKSLKRFHIRHCRVNGIPLSAMGESLKHLELIDLFYSFGYSERDIRQLKICAPHITVCEGSFNFEKH